MNLIKTTDDLKKYISVNVSTNINTLAPYMEQAAIKFIMPCIGAGAYADFLTKHNTNGAITPGSIFEEGLFKLQRAMAHFAYYLYIPVGQLQISDSGIHISVNENKKTAFEHQIVKLEESFINAGYDAIEDLLDFMEDNTAIFNVWAATSAYTEFKDVIITNAKTFSVWYNIGNSRRMFTALRNFMRITETTDLIPVTCTDLYNAIKQEIADGEISEANVPLMNFIYPAIAYLTMFKAITFLSVQITDSGIITLSSTNASSTVTKKENASDTRIDAIAKQCYSIGSDYLMRLRQYLQDNADSYPLFKNSTCYVAEFTPQFENSSDNKYFSV